MKDETEVSPERMNGIDNDFDTRSVRSIIEKINEEDKSVAFAVEKALPDIERAINAIVKVMEKGGRLYYVGAGTSGRLGVLDASECPPTFGVDSSLVQGIIAGGEAAIRFAVENAEDDTEKGKKDIEAQVTKDDAVIGIAASGTTPYVLSAVEAAGNLGALTIGIACQAQAPLSTSVDIPIEVPVGPEILSGSTRLKAGTAQKMVLNMISTTVMIKLGKVYGNQMVNLKVTNQKLHRRALRIVTNVTGVEEDVAKETIRRADGDVRAAILMLKYSVDRDEAVEALSRSRHHFRKAMELLEAQGFSAH